jgi:hypothetical protein
MVSVLFSGCSFVVGSELDETPEKSKEHPGNFCNILTKNLFGDQTKTNNIAVGGYSNERIFLDTAFELTQTQYDYIFVGWTSLHRYVFWMGLELYESKRSFIPGQPMSALTSHCGNDISWSQNQLETFQNYFLLLNHAHYYICDLISYVNILINLAETKKSKIFFINNILPWDAGYFDYIKSNVTPDLLTNYSKELLNSDNRDDQDINQLYHMMHNHYTEKGGINEKYWLNLYQSFFNMRIDFTDDKTHPGHKSHKLFAEFLTEEFKKHN